jgi:predicted nucleic acid-binding protein
LKNAPSRWVVDASVGIRLFIPEEHSQEAKTLFLGIGDNPSSHPFVPDLFYAECANILWKYASRSGYSASDAIMDITALKSLSLRSVPTARLMPRALDLALKWEISAYDGCYVALAEELKSPLVTADQKLLKRIQKGAAPVKWIGDFSKK